MKDIIKLFLLIMFLQFNQVYAAENIVYLDIEKLIHSSQAGKIINKNIKKNHKTNLDIFEKKENELKEEESKIIVQKNILNEEEFKKKIDNINLNFLKTLLTSLIIILVFSVLPDSISFIKNNFKKKFHSITI